MASPPPPHTKTPTSRRILRASLLTLAAILVGLVVCEALGWPFLRGPLERRLSSSLHREVRIGDGFKLHLLGSIRAQAQSLAIGPATNGPVLRGADGRPRDFLDAETVSLALPYATAWQLARGEHEPPPFISALEVGRLRLGLVRTADGAANWHFGPQRPDQPPMRLPQFGRLSVASGDLSLRDAVSQVDIEGQVRTREGQQGASGNSAAKDGGLQADATGTVRGTPLVAHLEAQGLLPLVEQAANAPPVPLKLSGHYGKAEVALEGSVGDVLRLASLDARFRINAPSLASVGDALHITLPATSPFVMQGRLGRHGEVWSADVAELTLGSSRLAGAFRYDVQPKPPKLSGRLTGKRLALPDLAPAFGAEPDKAQRKVTKQASGKLLPSKEFDIPTLSQMDADVAVQLDRFELGAPQLEALAPLEARIALRDGKLSIENLLARSAGGEVRGNFSLDPRDPKAPRWLADLRWSGVSLDRFIKIRDTRRNDRAAQVKKARGEGAPGYVSGLASGQAKLSGQGRSVAALFGSLDGQLQAWVKDGRVSHLLVEASGIDIAESLGVLISGDSTLPVRCAVTQIKATHGVLTPEVGVIDTPDTTLVLGGQVSLGDEAFALTVNARPHDMTPVALRGPLHIDGSFAKPEVHLDKAAIGVRVAAAAALATVAAPLTALLAFVDLGDGDKAVCSDAVSRMQAPGAKASVRPSVQRDDDGGDEDGPAPVIRVKPTKPPAHRTPR